MKNKGGRPRKVRPLENRPLGDLDLFGVSVHFGLWASRFNAMSSSLGESITWMQFDTLYLIYLFDKGNGVTVRELRDLKYIARDEHRLRFSKKPVKHTTHTAREFAERLAKKGLVSKEKAIGRIRAKYVYRLTMKGKGVINIYNKSIRVYAKAYQDWLSNSRKLPNYIKLPS